MPSNQVAALGDGAGYCEAEAVENRLFAKLDDGRGQVGIGGIADEFRNVFLSYLLSVLHPASSSSPSLDFCQALACFQAQHPFAL